MKVAVIVKLTYYGAMKNYLILLLFVAVTTQADIYRLVDEQGNVSYSDQADSNAEQIELKGLSTYTPTPVPVEIEEIAPVIAEGKIPDYQVVITSPTQDENIWGNTGTITVMVDISPELDTERGDQLLFKLDGHQVGEA